MAARMSGGSGSAVSRDERRGRKKWAHPEIVALRGVCTAIGTYGGSLKGKHATELGAAVVREAVKRATIKPEEVEHVVFGSAIPTDTHDIYLARVAAVNGGLPVKTPAFTLNRLCGSGLQAVVSAAQLIAMGDASVTVAGGGGGPVRGAPPRPPSPLGPRPRGHPHNCPGPRG